MPKLPDECWAITDHAAGNQRQALALATQMHCAVRHLQLAPRAPWSWLAPHWLRGGRIALPLEQRTLFAPPWPGMAIGCGRTAALFTRMLRTLSAGRCYTVQILDPRVDPAQWDTVIAPRHDRLRGANVLHALGSLNPVDDRWLADGRDSCPQFADLPRPRVGVLLGGPRHGMAMDTDYLQQLLAHLLARQRNAGGSLLVLTSRRTAPGWIGIIRQALQGVPGIIWAGTDDGSNPYAGVLGWADRLIVTPDSVNMLSEACAVGCPVHTLVTRPLPRKLADFHRALRAAGRLHDLDAQATTRPAPLRETATIAAEVRRRRAERLASR
ncbi:MAG TPA: mitochondrial fission ELM1 family protein [Rhodanobacter sp.]|nr:mitochondrial fission ELM1 family protein [Rhodanobacter sp.]